MFDGHGNETATNSTPDPRMTMTLCPVHRKPLELRGVGIAESTLSTALFIVNVFFLMFLYRKRRLVNWKTNIYTLNLAVSDLLASLALLTVSVSVIVMGSGGRRWCAGDRPPMPEWVEIGVLIGVTGSIMLTGLNYNVLVTAQFFAIRAPILHRAYCSTGRFRCAVILSQWIVVSAYVTVKSIIDNDRSGAYFTVFELIFMGLSIAWSVGAYSYVLHVARTWQKKKLSRQKALTSRFDFNNSSISDQDRDAKKSMCIFRRRRLVSAPSLTDVWTSLWTRYQTIANAGIHLAIYVAACVPLWLGRVLTVLNVGVDESSSTYDAYCSSVSCSVTVCLWFLRGVLDPFVHVWRHPELFRSSVAPQPVNAIAYANNEDGFVGERRR